VVAFATSFQSVATTRSGETMKYVGWVLLTIAILWIAFSYGYTPAYGQDKLGMCQYSSSYDYDRPPDPCEWWIGKVNSSLSTFAWQRQALVVCRDYHNWEALYPGTTKPDGLIAAWPIMEAYQAAWTKRSDTYLLLGRLALNAPTKAEEEAIQKFRDEHFKFNPGTQDELAEEVGLLMVLEAILNGY